MTDEEKKAMPILGGLRPVNYEAQNAAATCDAPFAQAQNLDDLPFWAKILLDNGFRLVLDY